MCVGGGGHSENSCFIEVDILVFFFSQSESVKKKSALYLSLATSPKSVSCASAACILKFLVSVACPEFNFHLAELVNHGKVTS